MQSRIAWSDEYNCMVVDGKVPEEATTVSKRSGIRKMRQRKADKVWEQAPPVMNWQEWDES